MCFPLVLDLYFIDLGLASHPASPGGLIRIWMSCRNPDSCIVLMMSVLTVSNSLVFLTACEHPVNRLLLRYFFTKAQWSPTVGLRQAWETIRNPLLPAKLGICSCAPILTSDTKAVTLVLTWELVSDTCESKHTWYKHRGRHGRVWDSSRPSAHPSKCTPGSPAKEMALWCLCTKRLHSLKRKEHMSL